MRIGPWGGSYGIRERKTVSCKQQIMKTLSNNYRNESYWSGKVGDKLCASGCCIWLQWQSIQRGRRGGIHLLRPFLPCGWRYDMSVIVMYSKWSHRLHYDACTAMDTKCSVRNVVRGKLREWLSVGNSCLSRCVKRWAQDRYCQFLIGLKCSSFSLAEAAKGSSQTLLGIKPIQKCYSANLN